MRVFLILYLLFSIHTTAQSLTPRVQKDINRGKKIANIFCDFNKSKELNISCPNLDKEKLALVATYLEHKNSKQELFKSVPKGAKCPVCGMFVAKYPKWASVMNIDGKKYYFDGIKDMLKFYFFDGDFKYNREKISSMLVSNYYTQQPTEIKEAFLVCDSKVLGPMGREFIAFSTKDEAINFINDHNGELVKFNKIRPKMVLKLDGMQ